MGADGQPRPCRSIFAGEMLRAALLVTIFLPGCSPTGSCHDDPLCLVNATEATCGKVGTFVAEDVSAATRRCQSLGYTEPVASAEETAKALKEGKFVSFKMPAGKQPRSAEQQAAEAAEQGRINEVLKGQGAAPSP